MNSLWRNVTSQASLGMHRTSLGKNVTASVRTAMSPVRNVTSLDRNVYLPGRNMTSPRRYLSLQDCDLTLDGFPVYGEEDEDSDTEGR